MFKKLLEKIKNIDSNTQYAITMMVMVILFWLFGFWVKSW